MSIGKGWFLESRRHKLSALGIKTGRKVLPKKPISLLVGDQKMFYPKKNDRTKKIVTGAVIGATVGALTYKGKRQRMSKQAYQLLKSVKVDTELKSAEKKVLVDLIGANQLKTSKQLIKVKTDLLTLRKGNPLPKGIRYAFDSVIKTGKYKGLRPRYAFKNNEVIEIVYFKGKKKMATKKLNYNDDVTYAQPTMSGVEIPEKVGFLKKVGRGVVAVGRGAKATFEKGQEISAKLRAIQEEREVKAIAKTQRQLLIAKSQLQIVRQKKTLEATKKQIESERESIFPKIF